MSIPKPPVALHGACSIVFNDTLYVYTPDAFQSIPLSDGGQWSQLPLHAAVTGATCVKAVPDHDPAKAMLILVGGSTNVSTTYSGLSFYTFSDGKWNTNFPTASVTENRRNHGATYLNSSSSVFIYGGSQDSSKSTQLSSQTFCISTESPYSVVSFTSKAPPVVDPWLMPWNDSHAAMIGGDPNNKRVWLFSPDSGWTDLGLELPAGVQKQQKAYVVNGDDGSKILEVFDFTASPNNVSALVLVDPSSNGPSPGTVITAGQGKHRRSASKSARPRRRDLTASNFPAYNGTLAPQLASTDYAVAQDSQERVVVVGDGPQPISIFDSRKNAWADTQQIFGGGSATTPSSSSPASTSSSASSSTAAASVNDDGSRSRSLTILGATLGTIFGLAFIVGVLLIYLRWAKRRKRRAAAEQHLALGATGPEKDRLSFADRGASFMSEAGGFVHPAVAGRGSATSTAIMGNKYRVTDQYDMGQRGAVGVAPMSFDDGGKKARSSGWSRYFSGSHGADLGQVDDVAKSNAISSDDSLRGSATVAPLDLDRSDSKKELNPDPNRRGRDPTAGPAMPHGFLRPGTRDYSASTSSSGRSERFSSGVPVSVNEESGWTPVARQDWAQAQTAADRQSGAPSSVYTASHHGSMVPREANAGPLFPRNSSHGSILGSMHPENRNTTGSSSSIFNDGQAGSANASASFPLPPGHARGASRSGAVPGIGEAIEEVSSGDGEQTEISGDADGQRQGEVHDRSNLRTAHSDMSWLNLGSSRDDSNAG